MKVGVDGDVEQRFLTKVAVDDSDNGCWEWKASLGTSGYGQMKAWGKVQGAHRIAYLLAHGEIPDSKWVLHKCDNRKCCRSTHLFLGTVDDNNKDKAAKGRSLSGENNHATILNSLEVLAIRQAQGTQSEIGKIFGITQQHVSDIKSGKKRYLV